MIFIFTNSPQLIYSKTVILFTLYFQQREPSLFETQLSSYRVGVRRLELPTSTSRTWRAANCATPRTPIC